MPCVIQKLPACWPAARRCQESLRRERERCGSGHSESRATPLPLGLPLREHLPIRALGQATSTYRLGAGRDGQELALCSHLLLRPGGVPFGLDPTGKGLGWSRKSHSSRGGHCWSGSSPPPPAWLPGLHPPQPPDLSTPWSQQWEGQRAIFLQGNRLFLSHPTVGP